ncbi:MAG: hypothetical protein M1816_007288 [Peltula sp. TS41687]|nr:MAG: hypothetical protein M1816_007288 [Peltula sp. TS41687]
MDRQQKPAPGRKSSVTNEASTRHDRPFIRDSLQSIEPPEIPGSIPHDRTDGFQNGIDVQSLDKNVSDPLATSALSFEGDHLFSDQMSCDMAPDFLAEDNYYHSKDFAPGADGPRPNDDSGMEELVFTYSPSESGSPSQQTLLASYLQCSPSRRGTDSPTQPGSGHLHGMQAEAGYGSGNLVDPSISQAQSPTEARTRIACQCADAVIDLLEERDRKTRKIGIQTLDSTLADQKNAVKHCSKMLNCINCNSTPDHMMLLTVVCRELILWMEEVVRIFIHRPKPPSRADNRDEAQQHNILFGSFRVNSESEWAPMIRVLIMVQLQRIADLLERLKRIAETGSWETQRVIVLKTEARVAKLVSDLQSMRKNGTSTV